MNYSRHRQRVKQLMEEKKVSEMKAEDRMMAEQAILDQVQKESEQPVAEEVKKQGKKVNGTK